MSAQLAFFGLGERERILAAMRENCAIYLTALRSFAREIALRQGLVSIDDVRRLIAERDFPGAKELGLPAGERIYGTVFSGAEWVPVRQVLSSRPERVARSGRGSSYIWQYRLRGVAAEESPC